jgi:hypothetical protein
MRQFLAFLTLVAGFVFLMGLVTHPAGTAQVINAGSNGLYKLFALELGNSSGVAKGSVK